MPNTSPCPPLSVDALTLPDGRRLGFAVYGDPTGTPTLLHTGTPGSRFQGTWTLASVDLTGVLLVVVERPGYGVSSPRPGRLPTDVARDSLVVADAVLGPGTFHLAGGSGGAPYAAALACAAPDRVERLDLFSGMVPRSVHRPEREIVLNRLTQRLVTSAPGVVGGVMLRTYKALGRALERPASRRLPLTLKGIPEVDRDVLLRMREVDGWAAAFTNDFDEATRQGAAGVVADLQALNGDVGFAYEDIRVETHVWHGDADRNVDIAASRRVVELVPGATGHWVSAGHLAMNVVLPDYLDAVRARPVRGAS